MLKPFIQTQSSFNLNASDRFPTICMQKLPPSMHEYRLYLCQIKAELQCTYHVKRNCVHNQQTCYVTHKINIHISIMFNMSGYKGIKNKRLTRNQLFHADIENVPLSFFFFLKINTLRKTVRENKYFLNHNKVPNNTNKSSNKICSFITKQYKEIKSN